MYIAYTYIENSEYKLDMPTSLCAMVQIKRPNYSSTDATEKNERK